MHIKRGDVKRYKGHADNGQIVKLVYVHEGYVENEKNPKRKELKNVVYFGGLYRGKDNEKLWKEVKEYIERQYDTEEIEKGNRKKVEEWVSRTGAELTEKERKKLEESWEYIKNNWKGVRSRVKKEEGVIGSSGADRLSQIRIYWKNGREMLKLVQEQKGENEEEEKYLSAGEILSWEKKTSKANGKYIEALRAHINSPISGKLNFYNSIANIC